MAVHRCLERTARSDIGVACIGQAGENLLRFASVILDKYSSAARGAGSIMGSKQLKAIAVRGNKPVPVADQETLKLLAREDRQYFLTDPFQKGTVSRVGTYYGLGRCFSGWHNNARYLGGEEVPGQIHTDAWVKCQIKARCLPYPPFVLQGRLPRTRRRICRGNRFGDGV